MKALKSLAVILVVSSVLSGCEKWKDLIHKEKEKEKEEEKKVWVAENLPMSGLQEVPQRETRASGSIDARYHKESKTLSYTVKWTELTGNPVGAHIHGVAPRGVNAGIKHDFFAIFPKTASGTFTNSVVVDGVAIKEDSLVKGFYYFNIHTPKFPGGEIRGQLEFK
ncbi:MAG: CHRD domain-containing protein [Chitinophagaceae bacterium]|nr:CHRD domain-containing protein [Chitinophagaceae bacterium]